MKNKNKTNTYRKNNIVDMLRMFGMRRTETQHMEFKNGKKK